MDKILDMIAKWDALGQGLFFFLVVFIGVAGTLQLFRFGVILFRGWPPCEEDDGEKKTGVKDVGR